MYADQGQGKKQNIPTGITYREFKLSSSIFTFSLSASKNIPHLSPSPAWLLDLPHHSPDLPEYVKLLHIGRVAVTKQASVSTHATNCLACKNRWREGRGYRVHNRLCVLSRGTLPEI